MRMQRPAPRRGFDVPRGFAAPIRQARLLAALLPALAAGCVVAPADVDAPEAGAGGSPEELRTPSVGDSTSGPRRIPGLHDVSIVDEQLDASRLQAEMHYFADRFLAAVAEATDRAAAEVDTAQGRVQFQQIKVAYVTSAINIASQPDPLEVLREYLVFLELATMLWGNGGEPGVPADVSKRIYQTLRGLRNQIRSIALVALSRESVGTIRELAEEWRRDNPDRTYIAFVRFSDLGSPEKRQEVAREIRSGGLLAPVREAIREAEELRLISERALFTANYLPILIEWQAELFLDRTLATPEVQSLLADSARFSTAAAGLGDQLTDVLVRVSDERTAAIDHFARVLARERAATLDDFTQRLEASGETFQAGVEESAEVLLPLSSKLSAAAADVRRVMELVASMQGDDSGESMDLAELEGTLRGLTELSGSLGSLATSLNDLVAAEGSANTLARISSTLEAQEQRIFFYTAVLVLLISVCVLVVVTVLRRTAA